MNSITKSWRTASVGILLFIQAFVAALVQSFDGDAATQADWNLVVTAGIAAIGFLTARDNQVTSEEAGAAKP